MTDSQPMQGSLFEEDFLRRTLGDVVRVPDVALGELVANAWDAGAANVKITIPDQQGGQLAVEDDGCGLDEEMFRQRWMTLAYDRVKHQGSSAEFPPGREDWIRRAYGRNGQGRHALLCFGDSYRVETWRDGTVRVFEVSATSGRDPFVERMLREGKKAGHGTKVSVDVAYHLPDADRIRELLSSRFLHDPQFSVSVNGVSIPLVDLPGFIEEREILVGEAVRLHLLCFEGEPRRTKHQSGVAFWIGGRLVGTPGWTVGREQVLDGRTRPGRRLTFVVKSDDLFDEVLPDWTGFRTSGLVDDVNTAVREAVEEVLREVLSQRISEVRREVVTTRHDRISKLDRVDQLEVVDAVQSVTDHNPLMDARAVTAAVDGMIDAKERRSSKALIQRVMALAPEDVQGLHKLLDEWSMRDALTVLDEIGNRIKVIETLEKLEADASVDELRILHPLVTSARWLFGPEFESTSFASNLSIRNAAAKVFGQHPRPGAFENPRVRPDLLFRPDSTLSVVATEDVDPETSLASLRTVLLIELKKGRSSIGRDEMSQADGYIEDLVHCGLLDGSPEIRCFVVGHSLAPRLTPKRTVGDPTLGHRIDAVTYSQLVRTANVRLFRLRDQVQERYPGTGSALLDELAARPKEQELLGLPPTPTDGQ